MKMDEVNVNGGMKQCGVAFHRSRESIDSSQSSAPCATVCHFCLHIARRWKTMANVVRRARGDKIVQNALTYLLGSRTACGRICESGKARGSRVAPLLAHTASPCDRARVAAQPEAPAVSSPARLTPNWAPFALGAPCE